MLFYMKKAGKVQKTTIYIFLQLLYNKVKCENCFQEGGEARVNKKVMYAVIGVIAVFLVIAVIILLSRGSRDTGQGTMESPDANDWNSGMEETAPGYLAEPEKTDGETEADTDVQEESKPKETEEDMEPAEDDRDTGRNHFSAEDDGDTGTSIEEEEIMGEKVSMIALADTKEEAKKIAELYGIELVNFSYGVAEYETTKDPQELIALGEKKNYPALSTNNTLTID